ncbi:MAG: DUF2314 domain-containing protein [Pseudomonadota bacterium]
MTIRHLLSVALCVLMLIVIPTAGVEGLQAQTADPTIDFTRDDPEMNAAINAARGSLDAVLTRLEDAELLDQVLSLKVAMPTPDNTYEHIFFDRIKRLGPQEFEGTMANEPVNLPGKSFGERYRFEHGQISDWVVFIGEKIHGAYTLRVMLPRMPPEDAEPLRQQLAPLPGTN